MFTRIMIVVAVLIVTAACDRTYDDPPRTALDDAIAVEVVSAELRVSGEPAVYSGTVEPAERANIASKIAGQVEKIYVSEGKYVAKGGLLIHVQSQDIEARMAQAEAAIRESKVHYDNAERNLKRFEALAAKKTATQKEVEDARAAFASAQARYESAVENQRAVGELLGHARLVAPFSGVVARKFVDVGDLATPGRPLLQIENTRYLKIAAKVPESEVQFLQVGMPVQVDIPSDVAGPTDRAGSSLDLAPAQETRIDQILPSADPASHQFEIKVLVDNPGSRIKSGMFARVTVRRPGEETLTVPAEAIVTRGQLQGVFVVDEERRARLRWIRTGRTLSDEVQVLAGLDAGEAVVVASDKRLRDGQLVAVK